LNSAIYEKDIKLYQKLDWKLLLLFESSGIQVELELLVLFSKSNQ